MGLEQMIPRRKSVRSYEATPVRGEMLENIRSFLNEAKPLYPEIRVAFEIMNKDEIKCIFPWTPSQVISVYSEPVDGALENAGFLLQQLDLYLQSMGMGSCWLGMGRVDEKSAVAGRDDGLEFVIMMGFGYPKGDIQRKGIQEFKRRSLEDISDVPDEGLEPARLAPSSVNSQPWYFLHEGETVHVYCVKHGWFSAKMLRDMNRIDIGICLAHIYLANRETFAFSRRESVPGKKGYEYMGSFTR